MKKETLDIIKQVFHEGIAANELPGGNMMVLHKGQEVFYYEEGFTDEKEDKEVKRDTIFRLYSMSKPVTAAAVMILMERGLVDLFDPVHKFLPGFKNQKVEVDGQVVPVNRDMNLYDLLSMSSGLVYGGDSLAGKGTQDIIQKIDASTKAGSPIGTVEAMDLLGQVPLLFQPGESWEYGASADVLGAVVEVVSGKKFGLFLEDEIFKPLGMKDMTFQLEPHKKSRLTGIDTRNNLGIFTDYEIGFESGGAGLVGTIDDYAKFATMLLSGGCLGETRILKEKTIKYMTGQTLSDKQQKKFDNWQTLAGHSYGNLMRLVVNPNRGGYLLRKGEYGWDGWLGCYFANFPDEELTILVMMQKLDAGTTSLTRRLRNVILAREF